MYEYTHIRQLTVYTNNNTTNALANVQKIYVRKDDDICHHLETGS